jgi:drug/metabolite transporter (DMT)-like permease
VQLLVPVLAAAAGVVVLNETVSMRLILGGALMLAGVLLAVLGGQRR